MAETETSAGTAPANLKQSLAPLLLAALACEDSPRSERDGSLSLLRLRYVLPVATLPAQRDLALVSVWWLRGAGQCVISARLRDVAGGVVVESSSEVSYEHDVIHEQAAQFPGVTFSLAGLYRVEVLLAGEVVGSSPLFVELIPARTTEDEAPQIQGEVRPR